MRVLVIGATGKVGSCVVEQLLALPSPPTVRVSSREPSKANFPSSVEVVQGDLTESSTYPALFASVDRVFLYAPHSRGGPSPVPQLIQALHTAGVRRVVFLSSLWVAQWPDSIFGRLHAPFEEAVKAAGFEYTFLRPGNFASNVIMWWQGEIRATGGVTLVKPNVQSAPVAPEDMAAVAVTALTTDALVNTAPSLTGPRSMSQQEQVEIISRAREAQGKAAIKVQVKPAEEWKAVFTQHTHIPAMFADALLHHWEVVDGKAEEVQSSERLTGKPATTFEAWVDKHAQELSA